MDCQCSASIVSPPLFLAQQMPKQPKEQLCFSFTFLKPETPLTYISVASIVLPYNNIKTPLRVYVGYQTEALEMFKLQFVTSNSKQWRSSGNIIFYPMFQIFAQDLLQILEQFSPDIYTWRTISNINFAHTQDLCGAFDILHSLRMFKEGDNRFLQQKCDLWEFQTTPYQSNLRKNLGNKGSGRLLTEFIFFLELSD